MTSHPKQQLTALLLCISATFGNLACAESVKLSLPDLENMMFTQSPALRSATNAVDAARAAVDTARTIPNPQIEVMNGTRKPRPDNSAGTNGNLKTVSLTQDLDMPWHRFPRVDGALAGLSAAQANEPLYRIDVKLSSQSVRAYGAAQPLKAGMAIEADVVRERLAIWEVFLEPLLATRVKAKAWSSGSLAYSGSPAT